MSNQNFFLPSDRPTLFSLPSNIPVEVMQQKLVCSIVDTYAAWQTELFEIQYPHKNQAELIQHLAVTNTPHHGKWAYYPWRNEAIHIPDEDSFRTIFFSRNYPIIEHEVQNRLWEIQIGSAGLSVGSNIAIELAKTGVRKFKLADFDRLAPSNNNRITGGSIFHIGENKASMLAKKLYELNPYCEIEQFEAGVNETNFKNFVQGCNVLIDEIDNFAIKNKMREYIHSPEGQHTFLITGADLGETPIVEIEGHIDPKFGGRVNDRDIAFILQGSPNKIQSTRMLVSVVGRENIPSSFLQNFINIKQGEQTYWAQLGIAATAVGAKIAGLVVEIARGNADKLQRLSRLQLREITDPEEKRITNIFNKAFGYLPSRKGALFLPGEASMHIQRTGGERNGLELAIGTLHISIQEIPGNQITDDELDTIHSARQSYKMWGDDISFLVNDPSDTAWINDAHETTHIIASVTGPNAFHKIYVLRRSYFSFEQLQLLARQNDLPFEFAAWKVKNAQTGEEKNIWDAFSAHTKGNIAINSRFCTFPQLEKKNMLEKDIAAITFAAMQLFTSETISTASFFNIITPDALQKIFRIHGIRRNSALQFDAVEKTLNLTSWKTLLADNSTIAFHKAKLPKYWAQNPMLFVTEASAWRQSAIRLLKAAKEKYG